MKANFLFIGFVVLILSFFTGCNSSDNSGAVDEKAQEAVINTTEILVEEDSYGVSTVESEEKVLKEQVGSEDTNENNTIVKEVKSEETVENTSERIISFPNIFDAFTRLYSY